MDNLWDFLKTRQLICALLFWAIAAYECWHISRHGHVFSLFWSDWIIYSMLGKWGLGFLLGFLRRVVHIRRHLESCSQDLLRQERR